MKHLEQIILGVSWLIASVAIFSIPKKKRKIASFIFLVAQMPAWIFGLLVVELGLLEYPYRLFSYANSTSFTFEFLVLPILNVYFNLYYPQNGGKSRKIQYYITYSTALTIVELNLERHTKVIHYKGWQWYWTWITVLIFCYLIRHVYVWFFEIEKQ